MDGRKNKERRDVLMGVSWMGDISFTQNAFQREPLLSSVNIPLQLVCVIRRGRESASIYTFPPTPPLELQLLKVESVIVRNEDVSLLLENVSICTLTYTAPPFPLDVQEVNVVLLSITIHVPSLIYAEMAAPFPPEIEREEKEVLEMDRVVSLVSVMREWVRGRVSEEEERGEKERERRVSIPDEAEKRGHWSLFVALSAKAMRVNVMVDPAITNIPSLPLSILSTRLVTEEFSSSAQRVSVSDGSLKRSSFVSLRCESDSDVGDR